MYCHGGEVDLLQMHPSRGTGHEGMDKTKVNKQNEAMRGRPFKVTMASYRTETRKIVFTLHSLKMKTERLFNLNPRKALSH